MTQLEQSTTQKSSYFHSFLLLLTATIWGFAFVAQSVGMDYIGPMTFTGARCVISVIALTPVVLLMRKRAGESEAPATKCDRKTFWKGGIVCGTMLFLGMAFQQIGIMYTTVGKAGFITTFYVVLVPLLGIFLGRKIGLRIWLAVLLAISGLYFLCMKPGEFSVSSGDFYVLISALCFTLQITCVDHYVQKIDGVLLSYVQMGICGAWGCLAAVLLEDPTWSALLAAALPLLYAGACSGAIGYTLQVVGQKGVAPTVASLIMSLESCISALAGWMLLNEVMSGRELMGSALMFTAIIISQLPSDMKVRLPFTARAQAKK